MGRLLSRKTQVYDRGGPGPFGHGEADAICNALDCAGYKLEGTSLDHLLVSRGRLFDVMNKIKKRGRPRIRTAEYWREYYTRKQREWRAAHPQITRGRKQRKRGANH
jgi:hypothetical protein